MQAYHIQDVGVQLVEHLLEGGARVCPPQGPIKSCLLDDWTHQRKAAPVAQLLADALQVLRVWQGRQVLRGVNGVTCAVNRVTCAVHCLDGRAGAPRSAEEETGR